MKPLIKGSFHETSTMKIKNLALAIAAFCSIAATAQTRNFLTPKSEKQHLLKHFGKADSRSLPQNTTSHYWNKDVAVWEFPNYISTTYDNAGNILTTINESYFNGGQDTSRSRSDYQYNANNQELSSLSTSWNSMQSTWDSSYKSFNTYDAYGHNTMHESYYMSFGVWNFSYGYKSIPTYNANNRVLEEVSQSWEEHLGAYRNSSKSVYGYIGQDVINELIQYNWDTITSTFVLEGRINNIVWYKYDVNNLDDSKVGSFTFQEWNDPNYEDIGRVSQLYDMYDNETEYKAEEKVGNTWVANDESTNTLTYNTLSQLTQKVTSYRYAPQTVFTNSNKYDYSNFRVFSGLQNKTIASNEVSIFPNPMATSTNVHIKMPIDYTTSHFRLYNVLGEEIYHTPITTSHTLIERGSLKQGIYIYQVITGNSIRTIGKLIIE